MQQGGVQSRHRCGGVCPVPGRCDRRGFRCRQGLTAHNAGGPWHSQTSLSSQCVSRLRPRILYESSFEKRTSLDPRRKPLDAPLRELHAHTPEIILLHRHSREPLLCLCENFGVRTKPASEYELCDDGKATSLIVLLHRSGCPLHGKLSAGCTDIIARLLSAARNNALRWNNT